MSNLKELNHPILKHKLTMLRDKNTHGISFRSIMNELSSFLAYEATKDLELETSEIETPLQKCSGLKVKHYPTVVSIMRAGNGMLDGVLQTLPFAKAGHIGIYRDKFIHNTVEYYFKIPDNAKGNDVLLLDPMLATGDTVIASLDRLKQYDVGKITILSVLVSAQGVARVEHFHPDVDIICIQKDEDLNENGYLLPGMGDAGDRLYNSI